MAKLVRRGRGIGGNGSPNSKIVQVNQRQGVSGIGNMQGTTRVIYDAVPLLTTAVNTTLRLFENCKTRQFPLTNLQENKLQVGESMVMERFSFYIIECAAGTTNALGVFPLSYLGQYGRFYAGQMSFSIGQDQVIKKLPLSAMYAPFNPHARFFGIFQVQPAAADPVTSFQIPHDIYHCDNNIVIPPTIEFFAEVQIPPFTQLAGFDTFLAMKIEGLGSLYAPKANY